MGITITRFDETFFDEERAVFDFFTFTGDESSILADFNKIITREGHIMIWRQRVQTLDARHGSPQSESTAADTSITAMFHPLKIEELGSGFFEFGDTRILTDFTNKVLVDDWIFDKAEDEDGFTTIAGTSATQIVVSGDQLGTFRVDDYVSIDDSNNDNLYLVTAISFASGETTITVALDADPGTGDTVYKAKVWYVKENQDWPSNADAQVRECRLRLRDQYKSA